MDDASKEHSKPYKVMNVIAYPCAIENLPDFPVGKAKTLSSKYVMPGIYNTVHCPDRYKDKKCFSLFGVEKKKKRPALKLISLSKANMLIGSLFSQSGP